MNKIYIQADTEFNFEGKSGLDLQDFINDMQLWLKNHEEDGWRNLVFDYEKDYDDGVFISIEGERLETDEEYRLRSEKEKRLREDINMTPEERNKRDYLELKQRLEKQDKEFMDQFHYPHQ